MAKISKLRFALAGLLAGLSVSPLWGADLPTKIQPRGIFGPTIDPYTGFDIGFLIGYGWDRGNLGATFPNGPADFGDLSNEPQGYAVGGFIGYNHRIRGFLAPFGLDALIGIEGEALAANLSGTAANPGVILSPTVSTTNDRWLARAVGRFGFIYKDVLFYGDVGEGWGGTVLDITCGISVGGCAGITPGTTIGSNSKTDSGLTWGFGMEFPWFFGDQWKARFQYAQFDFSTNNACISLCATPTPLMITQKNHVDVVLGGISYSFPVQ